MTVLRYLARGRGPRLALALFLSLMAGAGSSLIVVVLNQGLAEPMGAPSSVWVTFCVVGLATPLLRWLSQRLFIGLQQDTLTRLRVFVSEQVAHMSFRRVERERSSLLAVLIEDVHILSEFFSALPRLVTQGAIVVGGFTYLAWLSWQAMSFTLLLLALGATLHIVLVRRAGRHLEDARRSEDRLYDNFRALLHGAKELRLSRARRVAFMEGDVSVNVQQVRRSRVKGLLTYVGAGSWGAFMFFAVIGSVIFLLGNVMEVDSRVRTGYALMFLYMMFPLEDLLEAIPELTQARIALKRIHTACDATPAAIEPLATGLESVAVAEVTHRYRRDEVDGDFVLGPASLCLKPGEVVFLIGANGSGKTTLAKLMVALYPPESGEVRCNGGAVNESGREGYRQYFAAVFSDFHLFDRLLGVPEQGTRERAAALLDKFGLSSKVAMEGERFSTTALSSGQRRRLALVVAYLQDRPVYVFDEWAADQDPAYKARFYGEVLEDLRARGKAVLVITHDDRYFDRADRCLRLELGRLVPFEQPELASDPSVDASPSLLNSPSH